MWTSIPEMEMGIVIIYWMTFCIRKGTVLKEQMPGWTLTEPCSTGLILLFQAG